MKVVNLGPFVIIVVLLFVHEVSCSCSVFNFVRHWCSVVAFWLMIGFDWTGCAGNYGTVTIVGERLGLSVRLGGELGRYHGRTRWVFLLHLFVTSDILGLSDFWQVFYMRLCSSWPVSYKRGSSLLVRVFLAWFSLQLDLFQEFLDNREAREVWRVRKAPSLWSPSGTNRWSPCKVFMILSNAQLLNNFN